MSSIRKQYDAIAHYYDLLSDGDDNGLFFRINAEKYFAGLRGKARVLDCSCGTGDHAAWLASQGFTTFASDISDEMLAIARSKASEKMLPIRFFQSDWASLPKNTTDHFDLVLSPGNSFSHLSGFPMLGRSLAGIRKVVKTGGYFLFDIRNWEKTFEENNLQEQEFEVMRDRERLTVKYDYDIRGWNTLSKMIVEITDQRGKKSIYKFDFFPIAYEQLQKALAKAGFEHTIKVNYPDIDHYFVAAN